MEIDYEANLEHDLLMMVTEKILEHSLKEGTVDGGVFGKACPNPFRNGFANINPRVFVNYIMQGEKIWAEVEDEYYKNYHSTKPNNLNK